MNIKSLRLSEDIKVLDDVKLIVITKYTEKLKKKLNSPKLSSGDLFNKLCQLRKKKWYCKTKKIHNYIRYV